MGNSGNELNGTSSNGNEVNQHLANTILSKIEPDKFYHKEGILRYISHDILTAAVIHGFLQYYGKDGYAYDSKCWLPVKQTFQTLQGETFTLAIGEHGYPADWDIVEAKQQVVFTYYRKPVTNLVPYQVVTPAQLHQVITGPYFQKATAHVRTLKTPAQRRTYKAKAFDYVTPAGIFSKREDKQVTKRSGILVLDYDHVPDPLTLRDTLIGDEELTTVLAFISPSGDGLKQFVEVDLSHDHQTNFKAISNYIKYRYRVEVDPSGKNISRPCFVCYDPSCYLNPSFV